MKKFLALILFAVLTVSFAVMANAAVGTVVYATKIDHEPNMEEDSAFIDESWGEPAIVINSSSANTDLFRYWTEENDDKDKSDWEDNKAVLSLIEPEDGDIELYYLWDNKYFYFGMKTPDTHPSGAVQAWRGDGYMFWLSPLGGIPLDGSLEKIMGYYNSNTALFSYSATLDTSDWDHVASNAAASCYNELFAADDGYLYAYVKIPLMNLGLNPKTNLHGMEMGHVFQRISSVGVEDYGYAGWLYWGGFEAQHLNTVVLVDPAQGEVQVEIETYVTEYDAPETEAPETDAPETEAPETDAPETEAPETDAPETDAPETDAPETDAPETDAPETDAPVAPETDAPETDAPETDAPETDEPETDAPETDAPETDAPETDAPETDAPETDEPETDAPETDAPETDAPETDAPVAPEKEPPETQAPVAPAEPAKKGNTGLIIGIVAAVVVVGAVVGIVLGKKKK